MYTVYCGYRGSFESFIVFVEGATPPAGGLVAVTRTKTKTLFYF